MIDSIKIPPLIEASTVILVREEKNLLEVYLLKRSTKSRFMGGLYVFPGGHVDEQDRGFDIWKPFIDLRSDQIENSLGGQNFSIEAALRFGIASIRETLEEAGVLIAYGKDKTQTDFDEFTSVRLSKNLGPSWFKQKVMKGNWTLSLSCLMKWSHWVTPKLMTKRFDTRFFISFMPENQTCIPDNMETKDGIWITPEKTLKENLKGNIPLSPPTLVTLTQMLKFKTLEDLKDELKSRTWGDPVAPRLVPSSQGPVIIEPWDEECDSDSKIDMTGMDAKVLPAGSDFSRIWCDNGIWKPVAV